MKYLLTALLVGVFSCAGQDHLSDGNVESMEALEQALEGSVHTYKDEKVLDCYGGGTVLVKVNWTLVEETYAKKYYVSWEYDSCVTLFHGTINGKSHYSKNNEDKTDDDGGFWFTGVNYFADLSYSGSKSAECDSYMIMTKETESKIRDLAIKEHCSHPVSHWWGMWW
jgi:cation transport regulator ChaB